jgi:hypothetical protein
MATDPQGGKPNDAAEMGQRLASSEWREVGVVSEGESIVIGGIDPWKHRWESSKLTVELSHPAHKDQRHRMNVYRIVVGDSAITFAAGELSASVWGFYVPIQ